MLAENWQFLTVERGARALHIGTAWRTLSARSAEPSGTNCPELILPLMGAFRESELATVRSESELLLALPLVRRRSLPHFSMSLVTPVSTSGLAHVDADQGKAAVEALLRAEAAPLLLRGIPATGPFWDIVFASHHVAVLHRWERACLRPQGTYESWYEASIDAKRRRGYRRLQSRLAELGRLESVALKPGDDVCPWTTELLDLEASGWKGKRGTAMKNIPGMAEAFGKAARNLHAAGKLRFWKLAFDGRPIAMLYAIMEGNRAWLGKTAYDESFGKYSPGVLLIFEATKALFAEDRLELVDSYAIPNHPSFDNIWRDRLPMADVLIASRNVSTLHFRGIVAAERLRRQLRETAKRVLYRFGALRRS